MIRIAAIILAAGSNVRIKSRTPKPLIQINSKPIIAYALEKLSKDSRIREIILVVNAQNKSGIIRAIKKYRIKKIGNVVVGGVRRQDSVRNGLKLLDRRTELVLIHDAARPFFAIKAVSALIKQASKTGAAILGVPVKATIKSVVRIPSSVFRRPYSVVRVKETLERSNLWEAQTPQVFQKALILEAYRKFGNTPATDDAMLVEKLGKKVSIVPGSYFNIKITTPEDLILAEAIVRSKKSKVKR